MQKQTQNIDKTWDIRYSQYVDDLTIFDTRINGMNKDDLHANIKDGITIAYERKTKRLVMVEVKNASKLIKDINNLTKEEVIYKLKETMHEFA